MVVYIFSLIKTQQPFSSILHLGINISTCSKITSYILHLETNISVGSKITGYVGMSPINLEARIGIQACILDLVMVQVGLLPLTDSDAFVLVKTYVCNLLC